MEATMTVFTQKRQAQLRLEQLAKTWADYVGEITHATHCDTHDFWVREESEPEVICSCGASDLQEQLDNLLS